MIRHMVNEIRCGIWYDIWYDEIFNRIYDVIYDVTYDLIYIVIWNMIYNAIRWCMIIFFSSWNNTIRDCISIWCFCVDFALQPSKRDDRLCIRPSLFTFHISCLYVYSPLTHYCLFLFDTFLSLFLFAADSESLLSLNFSSFYFFLLHDMWYDMLWDSCFMIHMISNIQYEIWYEIWYEIHNIWYDISYKIW